MFQSAFERRVRDLANRAGLKVYEASSSGARLNFTVGGHTQPLLIIPFDSVWEFSCPSMISVTNAEILPKAILLAVLYENATAKRGFWCIEKVGGKERLEYMHNIPEQLLTPDEFDRICWAVVKQVEKLEEAFREVVARL